MLKYTLSMYINFIKRNQIHNYMFVLFHILCNQFVGLFLKNHTFYKLRKKQAGPYFLIILTKKYMYFVYSFNLVSQACFTLKIYIQNNWMHESSDLLDTRQFRKIERQSAYTQGAKIIRYFFQFHSKW